MPTWWAKKVVGTPESTWKRAPRSSLAPSVANWMIRLFRSTPVAKYTLTDAEWKSPVYRASPPPIRSLYFRNLLPSKVESQPSSRSSLEEPTSVSVDTMDIWKYRYDEIFWEEEGGVAKIFAKLNIIKHGDGSNGFSLRRSLSFLPQWVESPGEWIDALFFKISCYGNNVEREKKKKLCSFCFLFVFFFSHPITGEGEIFIILRK